MNGALGETSGLFLSRDPDHHPHRDAISREGVLRIEGAEAQCFVLDDETRVLARADFVRAIGRTGKVKGGRQFDDEFETPVFLSADNLKPFFPNDLSDNSKPILFSYKLPKRICG